MNAKFQEALKRMTPEDLSNLYGKVFGSPEGQLVLEDLKNRGWYYMTHGGDLIKEGMRYMVITIESIIKRRNVEDETNGNS